MNRFNINEDKTMDIKVIVFRTLALAVTSGLLWTGFTAADNEHGAHLEQYESEHEAVRELMQQGDILPLEQILEQARQQSDELDLVVEDGWTYFIHGWTQVIAEVFDVSIGPERAAQLSEIAHQVRATQLAAPHHKHST